MSQSERIHVLESRALQLHNTFIAYWCRASLRSSQNHSLEYAIHLANTHTLPLVVFTTLDNSDNYTARHLLFDVHTKRSLSIELRRREIACIHLIGNMSAMLSFIAQDAIAIITDTVYLKHEKSQDFLLLSIASCPVISIESNVVVPIHLVSDKQEQQSYTIRPKIHALIDTFLLRISEQALETPSLYFAQNHFPMQKSIGQAVQGNIYSLYLAVDAELCDNSFLNQHFKINWSISHSYIREHILLGGEKEAHTHLNYFLPHNLPLYKQYHIDPSANHGMGMSSGLSPYLRIGAISPIQIILRIKEYLYEIQKDASVDFKAIEASYHEFFEELVIRRELAYNLCTYNLYYDSIKGIPQWAKETLNMHIHDHRPHLLKFSDLAQGKSPDSYWNAAQIQLIKTGRMHRYMRMYWGKKMIEWTQTPEESFDYAVLLNNTYAIDAADPRAYAGISWCYGTHDSPQSSHQVFGTVRYMSAKGLREQFDLSAYTQRWLTQV